MAQVGTGNQLDIWLIVHPQSSSSRYLSSMAVLEDTLQVFPEVGYACSLFGRSGDIWGIRDLVDLGPDKRMTWWAGIPDRYDKLLCQEGDQIRGFGP